MATKKPVKKAKRHVEDEDEIEELELDDDEEAEEEEDEKPRQKGVVIKGERIAYPACFGKLYDPTYFNEALGEHLCTICWVRRDCKAAMTKAQGD